MAHTLARAAHANLMAFAGKYKAASRDDVTHTLITAPFGKYNVPVEQMPAFRHLFHVAFIYGVAPGFVEIKPRPAFRLFVDLDIKLPLEAPCMAEPDRQRLVECMHKAALDMFGPSDALVATCTPYQKGSLVKSGIHIVWPGIFVTQEAAIGFRHACVEAMGTSLGDASALACLGSWDDVVDETVYRDGTGLRMLGAAKAEKAATAYLPEMRLDAAGGASKLLVGIDEKYGVIPEWLALCSLCIRQEAVAKCIVIHAPPPGAIVVAAAKTPRPRAKSKAGHEAGPTPSSSSADATWLTSMQCGELVAAIRSMVSDARAQDLKAAAVLGVMPYVDPKFGPCAVVRLSSKRCLNLRERGFHQNNHTYLVVQGGSDTRPRVCQRCHSMRKVGVYYGPCCSVNIDISMSKGFSGKPMLATDDELAQARASLPRLLREACRQAGALPPRQ
ncbi:hypothetical protein COO60DRAFT_1643849 [Scenedesmus sp. NREL 46B-D3]|nr:hypothetical protein COO60DRAFT_1643849 [Scenedesmus sp. NREL 46B-D3]